MCKGWMNKEYVKQILWMLALTVPWGLGGFAAHTAFSLSLGMAAYWAMELIVPFAFYMIQKNGWGSELGKGRAAVHLSVWISFAIVEMVVFWSVLPSVDGVWKSSPLLAGLAVFFILSLCVAAAFWMDRGLVLLYDHLKAKGGLAHLWLGCAFFIGWIPGTAMISFLCLYYGNGMRLDPVTASFFLMEVLGILLYGKIALAMMTFGVFLFTALDGRRGERMVMSVFTAIFYLFLLFIPIIISNRMNMGSYADPSYLSAFPFLSDLWITGLALLGAGKLCRWIFKD